MTPIRALGIAGAVLGGLLAFREYLMLSETNLPLRHVVREPGAWMGAALLILFVLAGALALKGRSRR